MARGRKAIPDNLKMLKGTAKTERLNKNQPAPDNDQLQPPTWLPEDCYQHFFNLKDRLSVLALDSSSWGELAALLAIRISEIEECNLLIESDGRTYRSKKPDGSVLVKQNPAVPQRSDAMKHAQSLLSEFGLTPAALSKVSVPGKADGSDPFDKILGGK